MSAPKFNFNDKKTHVEVTGTVADFVAFFQSRPKVKQHERTDRYFNDGKDYSEFAHGSVTDITAPMKDFTGYEAAKASLTASGVMDVLSETIGEVKKRRRAKSEHDGEWNYDARFDIAPFTRRQVGSTPSRIVNIDVYGSFSANVSGKSINEFATYVAALIEMVETRGVMVNVRMIHEADTLSADGTLNFRMVSAVKASDELLNVGELLKALGANYYRRVTFTTKVVACDLINKSVSWGLGQALIYRKRSEVDAETSTLRLYSMPYPSEQQQLVRELVKLIQEGK